MRKKRTDKRMPLPFNPADYTENPHDKFAKFVLSHVQISKALLEFCLNPEQANAIDLDSLSLTNETFIDEQLEESMSDLILSAKRKDGGKQHINFLLEHKSSGQKMPLELQIGGYLLSALRYDFRQKHKPVFNLPIVLYHGEKPIEKGGFQRVFKDLPDAYQPYIMSIPFLTVDIQSMNLEDIMSINHLLLRKVFLMLKFGRNQAMTEQLLVEMVIFADDLDEKSIGISMMQASLIYLQSANRFTNQKMHDMIKAMPKPKRQQVEPLYENIYTTGVKEGKAKGKLEGKAEGRIEERESLIALFMKKQPKVTVEQLAELFEVSVQFVIELKKKLGK